MSTLISNPPYNMKWEVPIFPQMQKRFAETEIPPTNNANFAFILTALEMSNRSVFILPCGILTTDNKQEKEIRKYLVEKNLIDTIITCPNNMFEATSIPTCVMVLDKNKETAKMQMIDMREKFEVEIREQNGQYGGDSHTKRVYKKEVKIFTDDIINNVMSCIKEKKSISGYCNSVTIEDVKKNEYILTPSRYIEVNNQESTYRSYSDIVSDLNRIIAEKNCCKLTINETLAKNVGFDVDLYKNDNAADTELNELLLKIAGEKILKHNYFSATKNKNEISFSNNSKEQISSILTMLMTTWKQHIFYLNNEENRYLSELRDVLLPDLMSGKIKM